ncbi:hypothetical protein A2115_00385 [Candidatus Woesebacteria bacterium GWA1_41_8]|uniref:Uncharacterized protein n=1 Tax=Candidatus Woesebacteria bacterium GWA1_41_8 TaxID=1802471 RepID=A0A1F7WGF2_9BACT|nr:MAG: hypothetical protein A2115_00385 [Candidatus Woesebacteria bacterium GWA1_41_8]
MKLSKKRNLPELESVEPKLTLERARKLLGKTTETLTDEELQDQLVMIQYLAVSWLDDFERKIFNGKTLQELINEKYK